MLNNLIRFVAEAGLSGTVYNGFIVVDIVVLAIFVLPYRKKYNLTAGQTFFTLAIMLPLCFLWILLLAWAENGFQYFGEKQMLRGFVYFPLIAMLPARILKIRKEIIWDFLAPCFALVGGFQRFGCMFAGCCYGYPSSWGLWNPIYKQILFPIQLIDCLAYLLVCAICVFAAKKEHYVGNGRIYPLFLVLFGGIRFFLEFLFDNHKIFGNVSVLALHAALMFAVGVVWLCCIKGKEARAAMQKIQSQSHTST